jgi:hypothetical protein
MGEEPSETAAAEESFPVGEEIVAERYQIVLPAPIPKLRAEVLFFLAYPRDYVTRTTEL